MSGPNIVRISLWFLICVSVLFVQSCEASSVSRSFSQAIAGFGENVAVNLSASVTGNESFYLIDENYPWQFTMVSTNGSTNQTAHVKFLVTQNATNANHTYILRTPYQNGIYYFSGIYVFENMTSEGIISGPSNFTVFCNDSDTDGFFAAFCGGTDCNDSNSSIRPNATETCNGNVDDNCDWIMDVGCPGEKIIINNYYDGNTTNFSALNLSNNISFMVLEKLGFGKIVYRENITLTRSFAIDMYSNITFNRIFIDSAALPDLNKAATVYIYNLPFINPAVLMNGAPCPPNICTPVSYSNGTLVFNVTHFTTYNASESPYCGDGNCDSGETCYLCLQDCEQCPPPPDTTPPGITFVAPTPNDNANVTTNYIQINVLLSEAPGTCLLNWYDGTWTNVSMTIQGLSCYRNMTGLMNYTYQFRVYATDIAGNLNVSATRHNTVTYSPSETTPPPPSPPSPPPSPPFFVCNQQWQCSEWSACKDRTQTRVCNLVTVSQYNQSAPCPTSNNAPYTSMRCSEETAAKIAANCNDGVRNQDEEKIDCGGVCRPCTAENISGGNASAPPAGPAPEPEDEQFEFTLRFIFYVAISFSMLAISIFVFSRFRHRKPKKAASKTATQAPMKPDERKDETEDETEKAAVREAPAKADAEPAERDVKPEPEKTGRQTQTELDKKTYDSVIAFIREARSKGLSEMYIRESLLQSGLKSEAIDEMLRNIPKND